MIGTTGAAILVLFNFIGSTIVGVLVGGLMCLIRHRAWVPKLALLDAVIALVAALASSFVAIAIEVSHHTFPSIVSVPFIAAVAAVVVTHLIARLSPPRGNS